MDQFAAGATTITDDSDSESDSVERSFIQTEFRFEWARRMDQLARLERFAGGSGAGGGCPSQALEQGQGPFAALSLSLSLSPPGLSSPSTLFSTFDLLADLRNNSKRRSKAVFGRIDI